MKTFGILFLTIFALFCASIFNSIGLCVRLLIKLAVTLFDLGFRVMDAFFTLLLGATVALITNFLVKHGLIIGFAKIKLGVVVTEASGKLGGHVFARNRGGAYLRTKVTPVNPQTTAQAGVRNFLAQISQSWRSLTAAQRSAWNATVNSFVTAGTFGDSFTPSGFNLHSKLNQNLLLIAQSVITSPPVPAAVTALTSLSVVSDNTLGTIVATFAAAIPADQSMIVYATAGQSAGKSFVKSEYRKITVLTSADTSPADLTTAYSAVFGSLPATGQKVFIKMRPVIQASGISGIELSANAIAIES